MSFAGLCPTQRRCGHPGRVVFLPKMRKNPAGSLPKAPCLWYNTAMTVPGCARP